MIAPVIDNQNRKAITMTSRIRSTLLQLWCALLLISCASGDPISDIDIESSEQPLVGPPTSAAFWGLDLGLPFNTTQAHYIGQTYCPGNVSPGNHSCYSHQDHAGSDGSLSWQGLGDDQYASDFVGIGVSGNNTEVLAAEPGVVVWKAWTPSATDPNIYSAWGLHVHVMH